MAFSNQWYVRNPLRYKKERNAMMQAMAACNPKEIQLRDGRRGFQLDLKIPDPEGEILAENGGHYKKYTVLLAWNNDHPKSAANHFGGSVKCYFVNPSIREMEEDFVAHGRPYVPHLLNDVHPATGASIHIPCTAQLGQEDPSFTIVTAVGLVNSWLSAYTASKYRKTAYDKFRQH